MPGGVLGTIGEWLGSHLLNTLSWWQWAVLLAVPPSIILLYFLKLKRRPVEVPSTYLWLKSIEDLHVNSIWQRLRRNLLLFLQLLLILLAALALLRPSWQGKKLVGNRFIFLVDNSASMQATDVEPYRLDEAKRRVGELIDEMHSGDVAMLISFCDTARVEQTFTDDRRRLSRALNAIEPTERPTSLMEALKVASGLANPGRSAEDVTDVRVAEALPATLYIFSDGKFAPVTGFSLGNLKPEFVPIGDPAAKNVGIVAFSVARNENRPDRLQAIARLRNFGPAKAAVSLDLYLDGRLENAARGDIEPGGELGVPFDLGTIESGVLELKARTRDHLAVDDRAFAVVSPPRRAKVLLITPGDEPLEMALQTKSAAEVAEVRVEPPAFLKNKDYQAVAGGGLYDLVIYDRCRPERMPQCNTFWIGSLPPEGGWSAKPKVPVPQIIDIEASHPLMQWVELGDVALLEATPLGVPAGGTVLVDSDAGPMLAIAPREAFEDAVLGFVLIDEVAGAGGKTERYIGTNWPVRLSFPVFVRNLFDYLGGGRRALGSEGVQPGKPVALENPTPRTPMRVRTPGGGSVDMAADRSGRASFTGTNELGIYTATSGGKTFQQFAVNLFDPNESDIRPDPAQKLKIGYVEVEGSSGWEGARRELWKTLLLLGLVVLLVEWYIYNRRVHY